MKNLKNLLGFFLIIIILLLSGCFSWFKSEKANPELLVINVLDKALYDDAHIRGSINVPFDEVEEFAKNLDKNTHIVLYCSNYMCTASGTAARSLKKMGFKNVDAYEAGMRDWFKKYPELTEGKKQQAYLNMEVQKPTIEENDIQHITTDELKDKMKKMLNIEGF